MKRKPIIERGEQLPPLPEFLEKVLAQLSPEQKQRNVERQEQLRAEANGRGRLSPEAQRIRLGMAHEISARAEVAMLASEGHQVRTSEPLRQAMARHAEALAHQGRYDEALRAAPTEELKLEYFQLFQAVWRNDEETCPCQPSDPDLSLTHDQVMIEVVSQKHDNRLMPAIRCNECGFTNVRPLTPELQQIERARAKAMSLVHGRSGEDLKHHARELLDEVSDRRVFRR